MMARSGHDELALETQLLLQEVTQVKRATSQLVAEDVHEVSELDQAKDALLAKLRKKKEQQKQQLRVVNEQRYGLGNQVKRSEVDGRGGAAGPSVSPTKQVRHVKPMKLPVATQSAVASRQKKDLLSQLRKQAIQQGAQEIAKLFGYASHEDQIRHLNKIEKMKILQSEMQEKQDREQAGAREEEHDEGNANFSAEIADHEDPVNSQPVSPVVTDDQTDVGKACGATERAGAEDPAKREESMADDIAVPSQWRSRRSAQSRILDDEDDGHDADVEPDHEEDDLEDTEVIQYDDHDGPKEEAANDSKADAVITEKRDKAERYRQLLRAEALQQKKLKRLRRRGDFVESEAEEEEEEDVLKIGGLGDFGFGVPQPKTQESHEADEERKALQIREDDLEGIVDELSDDEKDVNEELDEFIRKKTEEEDRMQVKEVMRNVKEGFGRNRRAFSAGFGMGEARGRFNINELVAADGKLEAARLGLLESDEELSENEGEDKKADQEEPKEEDEEEDEEAALERALRERFQRQPQIYITSSESESEGEDNAEDDSNKPDAREVESDEERERQQMKLFSERARINRRIRRMKDVQREMGESVEPSLNDVPATAVPNILLEEDEESQELLKMLQRTNVPSKSVTDSQDNAQTASSKAPTPGAHPKLGRFNSYSITAASRSTSSFNRVADNCKLFSSGPSTSKGFVFTSLSSDGRLEDTEELEESEGTSRFQIESANSQSERSQGWNRGIKRASLSQTKPGKRRKSSLFSVLSSYQCQANTSSATS